MLGRSDTTLGSGHIGFWLGQRAEKEAITACEKHLEKIFTIVNKFRSYIGVFLGGDIENARQLASEILDLEREADAIKEEIINELMKSSLHPMDQEEIIRLLMTSDDIAAHLKSATRKLQHAHPADIPEDVKTRIRGLVDVLVEEAIALMDTIDSLVKRSGDVVSKAEKTERLEEKIDEMRVELIAKILSWGDVAEHVSDWLMVKEVIENIESASDKMEDTADLLRTIAILRGRR
ncbi:MAG: DUF47 family protein [Candidatus Verstraetearchaeota archaeon]|nr:DUF47 family protein [Candidatus Verstraetearchaeota archaeon]